MNLCTLIDVFGTALILAILVGDPGDPSRPWRPVLQIHLKMATSRWGRGRAG